MEAAELAIEHRISALPGTVPKHDSYVGFPVPVGIAARGDHALFTGRPLRLIRDWIRCYDAERPHTALGGRNPAEVYRGATPVDTMVKPLRALLTSPQTQQQQEY